MKEKVRKKKTAVYVNGSIALAAGAVVVMPKIIDYLSDKMYTPTTSVKDEDDDWGPEIVKREKKEDENTSEKEDPNGEL